MSFHLFRSDESVKIPSYKKETDSLPVESFIPDMVYIPCQDNRGNPLSDALKEGDSVKKGTLLGTRSQFGQIVYIYSSVSGTIKSIEERLTAMGKPQKVFAIQNDKKDEWELQEPLKPLEEASKEEILLAIQKSGVIGFGGAGFPTFLKYNSGKPVDVLIVNAIECEPYLTTDYVYGSQEISYLFKALPYLLKLTGAKKVAYCTKEDKPALIEAFNKEKEAHPEIPAELYLTKDRYPMGYERNLVTLVTGKEYGNIPIEAGAIVDNIYTYIELGRFFTEGKTPDLRCITVSGLVSSPKNVLTPYGVLAKDLVDFCGGPSFDGEVKVVNGGPLNGNTLPTLDYVTFLQTNGVLLLRPNHYRSEPCWHCGDCCKNCPMDLQPVQIQMALKRNDIERLVELNADRCCGCGLCSYMCPSRIDVSMNVNKAKQLVLAYKREHAQEKK